MPETPTRAGVPTAGTRVGAYLLEEQVGSGGNARVFRARDASGRIVALKLLHPGRATAEDLKRFQREFASLQRLDHPNVIEVYDASVTAGHAWLAMEFIDGCDLGGLVERWTASEPPDRWARVERILRGLCAALDVVHASGVVHRDLKPTNVLVTTEGDPKLTDFGVVKGDDVFSTNLTVAGQLLGTVAFMSPEQITGEPIDARSDLYALGAMLYVLLTGRRPVVADSIASYLARHLASDPPRPSELRPDVPPTLERICLRLLRKDPEGRYASAAEVLVALEGQGTESLVTLQGRDSALARCKEVLAASQDQQVSFSLGLVGPQGVGRTAMLEAVGRQARVLGLPVVQARDEWPPEGPRVVLADDLDQREGLRLSDLTERAMEVPTILVWTAEAALGSRELKSPSLAADLAVLGGSVVPLGALDRSGVVALLRERGLSGRLGPLLGRRLCALLGGLPGPTLEQVDTLMREGWLRRDGPKVVAAVPIERLKEDPLPVPEGTRKELMGRITGLSPEARRFLEVVAVLGGEASGDLAQQLAPLRTGELDRLEHAGLVRRQEAGVEHTLRLARPRLARVLYESLTPSERVGLHRAVAEALLARHARRPGAMAAVMADHLMRAGAPERAWPLLVQAARRAARRRDPALTLRLATRARDAGALGRDRLEPEEARRLERETLALRGEALLANRRPEEARQALTTSLELGEEDDATATSARSALGAALVALGQAEEAVQLLHPLLLRMDPGHPSRPGALRAYADALRIRGNLPESRTSWEEGIALARELGSRETEGLFLLGLAGTAIAQGDLVGAGEALGQARPLLRAVRSPWEARCLCHQSQLLLTDGHYREALQLADRAAEMAQQIEDLESWAGAMGVTVHVLELAGRERDAARIRKEIIAVEASLTTPLLAPRLQLAAQAALAEAWHLESAGAHFPALGRAEEAWELLPDEGAQGIAHLVALALCRLDPDTQIHGRARDVAREIVEELPPDLAASFRARKDVADLLQ